MRIGVDATCWHNRRGYGRHARALLRTLVRLDKANQYTLFLDCTDAAEPTPDGCEIRVLQPVVLTVRAASRPLSWFVEVIAGPPDRRRITRIRDRLGSLRQNLQPFP